MILETLAPFHINMQGEHLDFCFHSLRTTGTPHIDFELLEVKATVVLLRKKRSSCPESRITDHLWWGCQQYKVKLSHFKTLPHCTTEGPRQLEDRKLQLFTASVVRGTHQRKHWNLLTPETLLRYKIQIRRRWHQNQKRNLSDPPSVWSNPSFFRDKCSICWFQQPPVD